MTPAKKLRAAGLAIILAWGWKRAAIALIAGALSALAMAPFNAWPVLFLTFPVAVWLIDGAGAVPMARGLDCVHAFHLAHKGCCKFIPRQF